MSKGDFLVYRKYALIFFNDMKINEDVTTQFITLEELMVQQKEEGADYETIYSLQEEIDNILNLKVGGEMPVSLSRDEKLPALFRRIE